MYLMTLGLDMDVHNKLTLTSLSLLYRLVNVVFMCTILTAEHVLSRLFTPSHSLSGITIYYRF
jgi:hypothetical protein